MRPTDATRYSRHYLTTAITIAAAAGTLLGCGDITPPDKSGTFFGPSAAMAGGTARAYVIFDRDGAPTSLGMALSETALTGLPAATAEYVFALPSEASAWLRALRR